MCEERMSNSVRQIIRQGLGSVSESVLRLSSDFQKFEGRRMRRRLLDTGASLNDRSVQDHLQHPLQYPKVLAGEPQLPRK